MEYITIEDLEFALNNIYSYLQTTNKKYLEVSQAELKLAKNIDFSIRTYAEYEQNCFIEDSHGTGRMAMMLINSFGELFLNNGKLVIHADDPAKFKNTHQNTYRLVLKDFETHTKIFNTNPTAADKPYDFDTIFEQQLTVYPDKAVDTTQTAWESFSSKEFGKVGYRTPSRTLDFKSAFWKSGHEHAVNYIIKLDFDGKLKLFNRQTKETKEIEFSPDPANIKYYNQYFDWTRKFEFLKDHSWDEFILN